jgi:TET-Associated Glycosyltransferase
MIDTLIFTAGRPDAQTTLKWVPWARLVVQAQEADRYAARGYRERLVVLPETVERTLPAARQWILENWPGWWCVMLDDDLRLDTRKEDDPAHFRLSGPGDIKAAFAGLERALRRGFAAAGVCPREGGNRAGAAPYTYCTRMMRVLAYDLVALRTVGARFDRLPDVEDFDMTLQLLRAGRRTVLLNAWVQGQGRSQAPGGCARYRSHTTHARDVRRLAELHPGYVKVVEKATKSAWGGGTRDDVVISWRRAAIDGGAWPIPEDMLLERGE